MLHQSQIAVIEKVKKAFTGVQLDNGVGLLETKVIDKYGCEEELKAIQKKDERDNWEVLINHENLKKLYAIGGLPFFDAKGLRFHIPAYLCTIVEFPDLDIAESVLFTLTNLDAYNLSRFSLLDVEQKQAVCKFLHHIITYESKLFEFEKEAIENSIKNYWNTHPTKIK